MGEYHSKRKGGMSLKVFIVDIEHKKRPLFYKNRGLLKLENHTIYKFTSTIMGIFLFSIPKYFNVSLAEVWFKMCINMEMATPFR